MAAEERWYFTKEKLLNTPSRKCGVDPDKELSYRQQAANFIQDMGQRLQVNQLCINTAIVYVHRFYMFHSFTRFHRNAISTCALFLAAKVEEQPRKLEHVIKVAHMCLHREAPPLDSKSEAYLEQSHELISNENIMLQTLGFDVAIDHPHTHVVKCCQLVRGHHHHATASKELAQTSYFMATNSLHLTTMCLQYKPTVVACVCIHLACKWAELQIPTSSEGKDWYWYVDRTVTFELLEELTAEFLVIFDRCPSRLKRKMMSSTGMNDKIQDVAMVEKKLTAEFAAHASGNRSAASSAGSSSQSRGDKPEKSRSHNAAWTSSMTAKVLGREDKNSDRTPNGTPSTPEVHKESRRRDNSTASLPSTTSTLSSVPSTSKSFGSSGSVAPSQSPQPIVSPIRPSSRQTSSMDINSGPMVSVNSQSSEDRTTVTPHVPTSPTPIAQTTTKPKPDQVQRGITPKEYKERKKRERAAELAIAEEKAKLVEQPRKRTRSSSSSESTSSSSLLSLSRHMQPIVALTSLNLNELTKKIPSSKPNIGTTAHGRPLATTEKKSKRLSKITSPQSSQPPIAQVDQNNDKHKKKIDDPLPALVRPPILTPSPPLATGEQSKPDILDERPMTLSFPMEETSLNESSPLHLPQSFHEPIEQPKVDKDLPSSSVKRSDIKQTIKDRLIKHRKSKTQPKEPLPIPIIAHETLSAPQIPQMNESFPTMTTGSSVPIMSPSNSNSDFRTCISSIPLNVTPISRLSQSAVAENGALSSLITQERLTNSAVSVAHQSSPQTVDKKVQPSSATNLLPPLSVPKIDAVDSTEVLERFNQINTLSSLSNSTITSPPKPDKREKHKRKDKDKGKVRTSKEKTKDTLAAPIKLTIPKERINMTVIDDVSLKMKIPKRKISGSKSKTVTESVSTVSSVLQSTTAAVVAVAHNATPKEPSIGGLKLKITKDMLGAMGTYSVGNRESNHKEKRSEKESRKRKRPTTPVANVHPPLSTPSTNAIQMELNQPKPSLLPLPTFVDQTDMAFSKAPKSGKSGRKSQSPQATMVISPYDVPPSSNTRSSSSKLPEAAAATVTRSDNYKTPSSGRGHRGRGRGGGMHGHPLHPRYDSSHQVILNAGPYPYTPYYQFPPSFFNHPPMGHPPPPPRHGGPPMHRADYPPPFYGQPPLSFRSPPPPMAGSSYQQHPQDSRVMPLHIRRPFPPPLPSEPPPIIPPPPPPE